MGNYTTSKNITISDVAKAAGVSLGTVSRVLNNRDGKIKISDKTKEKVLTAAKNLGYKPNPFALALRTQKTGVIGAVIRDISDPFLRQIIREVQREFHNKGIELLIGHAEYELETAERQLNLMLNHWFDGLLLLGNLPGDERTIHGLQKRSTPIVAIASGYDMDLPSVNFDNSYGTEVALDYLYELGHRQIAFIGNSQHAGVQERFEVFLEFIKRRSLFQTENYLYTNVSNRSSALICSKELLCLPDPPTAIFCAADLLALGAMSGALQMGWQVPKDISILGYDDIEEAADSYSPLTTVRQPADIAAKESIKLLLQLIDGSLNNGQHQDIVIKPELVVRQSCTYPKSK